VQTKEIPLVTNPTLLEVYKLVLSLYGKGSLTKQDLKEFNFSLKEIVNRLPETEIKYLQ
jgi:hypothetical protein